MYLKKWHISFKSIHLLCPRTLRNDFKAILPIHRIADWFADNFLQQANYSFSQRKSLKNIFVS